MASITHKKTYASLPKTVRGQFIVVNGDPKGKNFLYCNGNQIFIRNIEDPSICDVYVEHVKETTCAKYSPSGFYIASGDIEGKVRVWDTVNPEHILKKEHMVLGGAVKDLDWSSDNTKICAVGEGKSGFAKVFSYDSGNSVGEMSGHHKSVNSVSMKPTRPFKIVTGSEDFSAVFYEGPPFKFSCTKSEATNFVNCVQYAPNGEIFIVGGSEGKLWMYDGKSSDLLGELGEPKAHKGGIYAISFSGDSKKLLSVSGDKTAKIWDIESKTCEQEFVMGKTVNDMQVGCLWQGEHLLTVSLSGHINYLDQSNPSQPKRIIKGHNRPITALAVGEDSSKIYSASSDGMMIRWDVNSNDSEEFQGKGHTNQVTDMVMDGAYLMSVGFDDTIRFNKAESMEYGESVKLESQPRAVDSKNGVTVVACINHIEVFTSPGKKASSTSIKFEALSCSLHPNGSEVAIGEASSFIIYSLSNGTVTETKKISASGPVTAISYSYNGNHLCVTNDKNVKFYDTTSWEDLSGNWSSFHTAKVVAVSWSPDSRRLMSAALDSKICLWTPPEFSKSKPSEKAHPMSHVNKLKWLDSHTVVTGGQDCNLKIWNVSE